MSSHFKVQIAHIYISSGHNYFGRHGLGSGKHPLIEVKEVRCIAGKGLEGDRFVSHPKPGKGQVTFFDEAVYDGLCQKLKVTHLHPGVFRRNVVVRGLHLPSLIGKTFEIQGIVFRGTQDCAPCYWMEEAFAPGAEALLQGKGGLRAEILNSGTLKRGESSILIKSATLSNENLFNNKSVLVRLFPRDKAL